MHYLRDSLEAPPSDDELRLRWRKSLNEEVLRSLASDWLRGFKDQCTEDAYLEYQVRWGEAEPGSKRLPKNNTASKKRSISRYK